MNPVIVSRVSDELIDPLLRTLCPRVCVGCDYALEGLASSATCPECGTVEDPAVLTLVGWSRPPAAKLSWLGQGAAALSYLFIAFLILSQFARGRGDRLFTLVWVALALMPLIYVRGLAFLRGVQGPPMRLRLCPRGFERRVGPGPLKLRPWLYEVAVTVQPESKQLRKLQTRWDGGLKFRDTRNFFTFYFESSVDQGTLLKEQIRQWIEAA